MFQGSMVALITPFTEENEIDTETLVELVEWHIAQGTDVIMCCGTTGEAPTLSDDEQLRVIATCVTAARKRVPIVAGTGTYDTRKSVELTREAKALGADGCLVVVPYYSRPTPEGCLVHYKHVADVGLPVIVYHHPGRTGIRLSAAVLSQICEHPSVVGVKDASGDVGLIRELKERTDKMLLTGDDLLLLPSIEQGAVGVVSIVANVIPKEWQACVAAAMRGEKAQAEALFSKYKGLCQALVLETNPQGVKYAMEVMGKSLGSLRLPLVEPRAETKEEIIRQLEIACRPSTSFV